MTEPTGTSPAGQGQVQGTAGSGPWAEDLNVAFTDEAQRQAVDAFLREKVQPYVTNLEKESGPALELYRDLQANPGAAYVELTTDLFGEEEAKAIIETLEGRYGETPPPATTPPANKDAQPNTDQPVTDTRIQEMLSDWEEQRNERLYNSELERLQTANPQVPIKDNLFRPFVVAEDGDMDKAFEGYRAFLETARADLFPDSGQGAAVAPPTLGAGTAGTTPPPTEVHYDSVGEAIDAWAKEGRATGESVVPAPPAV